jgi:U4/U6.U5 tri-snRNP component SNU23
LKREEKKEMSGVYQGGGDTNFRRTWNKDDFVKKGVQRSVGIIEQHPDPLSNLTTETKISFQDLINTTKAVASVDETGWSCSLCGLNFKDNLSYADHIKSKEHQTAIGFSVERSTVKQVRERLARGPKIKEKRLDPKERMLINMKNIEREKQERKDVKRDAKIAKNKSVDGGFDESVMAEMGFGNFGSSKK